MQRVVASPNRPATHQPLPRPLLQVHTHDYCNIGGSNSTVDDCGKSSVCPQPGVKFTGTLGVLPGCSGANPYFGGGSGTIMSYWHVGQAGARGRGSVCCETWLLVHRVLPSRSRRLLSLPTCRSNLLAGNTGNIVSRGWCLLLLLSSAGQRLDAPAPAAAAAPTAPLLRALSLPTRP